MVAYVPIVLGTATLNAIIVGILYLPLMKVLKKEVDKRLGVNMDYVNKDDVSRDLIVLCP